MAIRGAAILVLLGVAAAAAYVSYHHFYSLAIGLGERHEMALLYPAMSDGVIVMASLVLLYCSRRGLPTPALAWVALAVGGAVTLAANVANGWSGGTGQRLLSALAPLAFVGAYELLMWLVRSGHTHRHTSPQPQTVCQPTPPPPPELITVRAIPANPEQAARWTYEASLEPGNTRLGRRPLLAMWGKNGALSESDVVRIMAEVDATRTAPAATQKTTTPPLDSPHSADPETA